MYYSPNENLYEISISGSKLRVTGQVLTTFSNIENSLSEYFLAK
jgi:hypothetical protein